MYINQINLLWITDGSEHNIWYKLLIQTLPRRCMDTLKNWRHSHVGVWTHSKTGDDQHS